jgi:plastocyanin domain-containing protein
MLIINITGLLLIALIIWWFWLYIPKSKEFIAAHNGGLIITVEDGVYSPAHIRLVAETPTTIQFLRKDGAPCSETVLFPELDISENLPLNKVKPIELPALAAGEYAFHCQMQMYRGVLIVK